MDWYLQSIKQTQNKLRTNIRGLSAQEASRRLKQYGQNVLPRERGVSIGILIVRQCVNFLSVILILAAGISWYLKEPIDAIVIVAAVILNGAVGFVQEYKANTALAKLQNMVSYTSYVIRDGREHEIASQYVVTGDIVSLSAGDRVPADARIVRILAQCQVHEAILTGESESVSKSVHSIKTSRPISDQSNMLFAGTVLTQGKTLAVVVATGADTEIGKIATIVRSVKEEMTPLQKGFEQFSRRLGLFIVCLAGVIFLLGITAGHTIREFFGLSVSLAVAAIPEGLVVAVTVILAIGMERILKEGSLVRRLASSETLGSTTVICADKTGTLTEGEMRVERVVVGATEIDVRKNHISADEWSHGPLVSVLRICVLCNDAFADTTDGVLSLKGTATDRALLLLAQTSGIDAEKIRKALPRVDEVSFSSERQYMVTAHHDDGITRLLYKGAPEKLLNFASHIQKGDHRVLLTKLLQREIAHRIDAMSKKGLRVLALAVKELHHEVKSLEQETNVEQGITLIGFVALRDPVRQDAKEVIRQCHRAGMKTVMITGDHRLTAQRIASELGISHQDYQMIDGSELDQLSDDELIKRLRDVTVYARVTPEHKLRIVSALQSEGEVVAMTGDGVNDAPALKKADIGIALGAGTDVAKGVADLVLLDNRFSTIVKAIVQGRVIYDNIRKVVMFLLTDSFSEIVLVVGALVLGLPLPLLASQILWINLIGDGLPTMALTFDPGDCDVLRDKPRRKNEPVVNNEMRLTIIAVSLVAGLSSLLGFIAFFVWTNNIELARTVAFAMLGLDSVFYVFSLRTPRRLVWQSNLASNRMLLVAIGCSVMLQILTIYYHPMQTLLQTTALGWVEWLFVVAHGILLLGITELLKYFFFIRKKGS